MTKLEFSKEELQLLEKACRYLAVNDREISLSKIMIGI